MEMSRACTSSQERAPRVPRDPGRDATRGAHEESEVPRALGNGHKRDRAEKKGEDLHADEWPIEYWDCPQQENGFDCGVFVAKYCECLGRGDDFSFSQDHKGTLRRRLVVEICRKHVPDITPG